MEDNYAINLERLLEDAPMLIAKLDDEDYYMRDAALAALEKTDQAALDAGAIVKELKAWNGSLYTQHRSFGALGLLVKLGPTCGARSVRR